MAGSTFARGTRVAAFQEYLSSDRAGFHLLLFLLFVTPLSQAALNFALAALVLWWLSAGNPIRDFRASPLYVKCLLLFSIVPLVAIFTSDLAPMIELASETHGALKIGIVSLPVYALAKAGGGSARSTVQVMAALVAGGVLASVVALASWDVDVLEYPPFLNTGPANHVALYMAPVMAGAIALAWTGRIALAVCGWVALLVLLSAWVPLQSFTAYSVMALVGAFCICASIVWRRYGTVVLISACLSVVVLGAVTLPGADQYRTLLNKEIDQKMYGGDWTAGRVGIFRTAIETHQRHLWFGAGFDQFKQATSRERTREALERRGRDYGREKRKFVHHSHGHNIWTHTLIERGLAGIVFVALFFALSGARIAGPVVRGLSRQAGGPVPAQQLALLAVAAWATMFVGGIGNTTLHDEHGLIGVALLVWCVTSLDKPVPEGRAGGSA